LSQRAYIKQLEQENAAFRLRIRELEDQLQENVALKLRVSELEEQLLNITRRLEALGILKTSRNSSLPPSTDLQRKSGSLREKSEKKPGGQPGHEGSTLLMREVADKTERLESSFCSSCGHSLAGVENHLKEKRQVIDLAAIQALCTEYQQYEHVCPHCAHRQFPAFPAAVNAPVQYGPNVHSLVSYMSVYQYLPYKRLQDFLRHCCGLPISQGTIDNIVLSMSGKGRAVYEALRQQVAQSSVLGSDETSAKVNGKKQWVWTWQNTLVTYLAVSLSRGKEIIERLFPGGFPNAVVVSDRWKAQLNTRAKGHQLCFAHLLRDLNYLIEAEKSDWAIAFKSLLKEAILLKKLSCCYQTGDAVAVAIEEKANALLAQGMQDSSCPQTKTFQKSINQYREALFRFLYDPLVEYDNNASERAVRNLKVKLKVSGQFKSGQEAYCILRSIIDTAIKNYQPVFKVCEKIYLQPKPTAE
jgi:transposase